MEPITVITITRGRPELLSRAIRSVQLQDYEGRLVHQLVLDDGPTAYQSVYCRWGLGTAQRPLHWRVAPRKAWEVSGPARLARLRNRAVEDASTRTVAFLDDDNEIEPHHLRTLMTCMWQTGCPAVHSQRRLYRPDGMPFLEPSFPWKRDPSQRRAEYLKLSRLGLFVRDSNVVRDRADPPGTPEAARMVDTSEWLFQRELLLRIPFCQEYDHQDWVEMVPEDNKLLRALVERGVDIACTHTPSLRYSLGGYSNCFPEPGEGGEPAWVNCGAT